MPFYYCRKCGMTVEENYSPRTSGCTASNNTHSWVQVSGKTRYYCRKCHMSVICDAQPNPGLGGGCSGISAKSHSWVKG